MNRLARLLMVSALSVLAATTSSCSGAPGQPAAGGAAVVSLPPAPRSPGGAGSHAGEPISLSARNLPSTLVVDGSVAEWGLDAKRNAVAIGVSETRVVLAITWAEPARPVVALALASHVPPLPEIGWAQRGGTTHELTAETCEFEQIPQVEGAWTNGQRNPPEVTRACLDVIARYDKMRADYRERFIRRLRIEGDRVSILDRAGASAPLGDAVVRASGESIEVELPLIALPDTTEAPLGTFLAGAAFGELPEGLRTPPSLIEAASDQAPTVHLPWTWLELPAPIGFGDHPDLLASAFEDATGSFNGAVMSQRSYSPARPGAILIMTVPDVAVAQNPVVPSVPGAIAGPTGPDRPALFDEQRALFTPIGTHGQVTFGLALDTLVTLVGGKLVAKDGFGQPEATARRGNDLHLFRFSPGGFNWMTGFEPPRWRAVAIAPDGKIAEVADDGVDFPGMHDAWDDTPTLFHDADWSRFGLRGRRHGKPKTVTWQWDRTKSQYVSSVVPPQTL